jgi:hypothetical protein
MCIETFERIAREGRKFGLGLVLSSQRPSELSETVLAQCNTFLLHRLANDRDQHLVGRLVPDNLGGLLDELPALPAQNAILLGWATPIPVLMQVRHLEAEHRPRSEDPDYWRVWTERERRVDWTKVVRHWRRQRAASEGGVADKPGETTDDIEGAPLAPARELSPVKDEVETSAEEVESTEAQESPAELRGRFEVGDQVTHPAFGPGEIVGTEPGGIVTVRFGDGHERKLMAEYAPLTRTEKT